MCVPKLRFPEFKSEWKREALGKLGTMQKGSLLSKADLSENGNPCILYGELYTKYGEITTKIYSKTDAELGGLLLSKNGDVLIPASGETAIDISTATCVLQDGVVLGGDLNVYRSSITDGRFISYELNHKKRHAIAKVAQGVSIVHLYADQLKKLSIMLPSFSEQQKIAEFLSVFDNKIINQQKKILSLEKIKKGFMQKIFSQEIRFKDDNREEYQEWKGKKIIDCLEYEQPTNYLVSDENYSDRFDIPVLTANKSFILGYTDDKNGIYSKGNVIIFDDFTMDIKYVDFQFKVKSSAIKLLTTINGNCLKFMYALIANLNLKAESHRRNYISIVQNRSILMPTLKEQQKIADFLSTFDRKIEVEKEILQHWKNIKRGLLQQMFI